ncbi:uncharacterized protein BXZ73DRAFT_78744 [Epithele typhae]|uniref:uncharacterized protein n=1 Tax=Epithele typhae TaxID=378194 RepID=UPI0020078574|nr:uncharacterized protein BXZ73DRAFT_78744 [Epithele typhae]KAH9926665.1 hypothetical protein BXZ73DRAFT_78744 [Epithele typhae]
MSSSKPSGPQANPLNKSAANPPSSRFQSSSDSNSSSSTARISSPLNPSAPFPHKGSPVLPAHTPSPASARSAPAATVPSQSTTSVRSRGGSVSTIRPPSIPGSITRVVSNPVPPSLSSSTTTLGLASADFRSRSRASSDAHTSRGRSKSPIRDISAFWQPLKGTRGGAETPPHGESTSWWTSREISLRPWREGKKQVVPAEQSEGYLRTRERPLVGFLGCESLWFSSAQTRIEFEEAASTCEVFAHRSHVAEALVNVLGWAEEIGHELLELSTDLLRFAPIPGLEEAARTLLGIWDALQMVDINRLACLRLTERCATVLISIREEISDAGDDVSIELRPPLNRLVESYKEVHRFLFKQARRPFIKRYLQRDEIARSLSGCHNSITDALTMFNTSIQIRILKQVLAAEKQRQADTAALLDSMHSSHPSPSISSSPNVLMLTSEPGEIADIHLEDATHSHSHVIAQLQAITSRQNERDSVYDTADLRQLMRTALQANNDLEMIRILQVGRDEMPEAIKTLQRALEAEVERENSVDGDIPVVVSTPSAAVAEVQTEIQVQAQQKTGGLTRSATVHSDSSHATNSSHTKSSRGAPRDTLDREFIETGIDALRRFSGHGEATLPSWTITRYEVEREQKIGMGFFSDVYRGTWRDRVVAIKVLAPTTPKQLFVHEIAIWKTLQHPNVLELLGASSASSDPPWFFVSPYLKHGSLVTYLKGLSSLDGVDLLKMIHEIAKGMTYLHAKGVLHGDLKAANVLVNDRHHCVISDFGQSEMKTEAYRVSGLPLPHGTLRWQAPELMAGLSGLTQAVDLYAFAITCVELLTKGALPWSMADDDAVRYFVLHENMRPELPLLRVWSSQLSEILGLCWHRDSGLRPSFEKVDKQVQQLRSVYGLDLKESPAPRPTELEHLKTRKSPDMHPIPLPLLPPDTTASFVEVGSAPSTDVSFMTATEMSSEMSRDGHGERVDQDPSRSSSRASSSLHDSQFERIEYPRHLSPPPPDELAQNVRDERRYRMLLQHEFHPSLTLPLWSPGQIAIGAVGYHSKATGGEFITLFNAFEPMKTAGGLARDMPSLYGYGRVNLGSQRQDKRNVAQRGMDLIQSWLTSTRTRAGEAKYSRRYATPLRAGHKAAHLFTESTVYRYIDDLATPKKWLKANVDDILKLYGAEHHISKEDLHLVIGTLEAQDYALFVSHDHPDSQVEFNVFSAMRTGQPWGEFRFSSDLTASFLGGGPRYDDEPQVTHQYTPKISTYGNNGGWSSVLLARLRFKPDSLEPTSQ